MNRNLDRAMEAEEIYKDMLKMGIEVNEVVYGAMIPSKIRFPFIPFTSTL